MSPVTAILSDPTISDFDAYDQLVSERNWREEYGFDTQEIEDAIAAQNQIWDEQQRAEIAAEMAIEHHYESVGYDTDGIWR